MTEIKNAEQPSEDPKTTYGLGFRHYIAFMHCLSLMIGYAIRAIMSMAIVSMTDPTQSNSFEWSTKVQSTILSSFFWGYVVLQIPAGIMAAKFGGKVLISVGLGINSLTLLLLPVGSYYGGWQLVCACRVLQGLGQGFLVPSMHSLIGKWVPLEEKSSIGTFIYAGGQIGTAVQMLVAGYIAEYWGWPAIFYATGTFGAIWTVLYILTGASSPQTSRLISEKERLYIQKSLGHMVEQKKVWKYGPALALIGLSFSPIGNVTTAVVLLTVVMAPIAGTLSGYMLVHIDMAPNFAAQMMGITNCLSNITSLIAPLIAGALLVDDTDPGDWRKVFFLSSAVFFITNTIFVIFGTSKKQKWNDAPDELVRKC